MKEHWTNYYGLWEPVEAATGWRLARLPLYGFVPEGAPPRITHMRSKGEAQSYRHSTAAFNAAPALNKKLGRFNMDRDLDPLLLEVRAEFVVRNPERADPKADEEEARFLCARARYYWRRSKDFRASFKNADPRDVCSDWLAYWHLERKLKVGGPWRHMTLQRILEELD